MFRPNLTYLFRLPGGGCRYLGVYLISTAGGFALVVGGVKVEKLIMEVSKQPLTMGIPELTGTPFPSAHIA